MDAPSKKSFPSFLSRSNADRSLLYRANTSASGTPNLSTTSEERGKLGLTTVYEPLHRSPVLADIIFIHGLGGNSRKTWSSGSDPDSFWPAKWLPTDPDFADARIHVFGYNADWRDRQHSPLNIHDFAQSLVGELKNNPGIRKYATPIVLVGHSMGGCVAKKAYILARLDPNCKELVERIHSMFFLGTPHRGADLAPILESIMTMTWGKKPFLQDLLSNTDVLAETNDAFRHYALELRLWSFYETQPVRSKMLNKIVVEKASATLGYPNEEIAAMNTDHRHLCKFENREDPNYRLLRNALHTVVDLIRDSQHSAMSEPSIAITQPESMNSELLLDDFVRLMESVGINDTLGDDLMILNLLKEPGSCTWLTHGDVFSSWERGTGPQIMWLIGRPAAGKSVLSSHVVEFLTTSNTYCSYFFFKYGKRGKSTLSDCFLSLAYQMAMKDETMRRDIMRLLEDQTVWDRTDEAIVWRRLFIGAVFKSPTVYKHSWVIDGVDECSNFNSFFTKKLLATLPPKLRVFATSRDLEEIGRGLTALGSRASRHVISEDDTLEDMRLFLSKRLRELDRYDNEDQRQAICSKILQKSRGSFLWVRLVLQDFENAWTDEAMEAALRDVPSDLHEVFLRILQTIEADPKKTKLAKSILSWVVSASRPLSIDELRCAIRLDINETIQSLTKAISSICGQLVFVDHAGKVQLIHETARKFLLNPELDSELAITKDHAHNRLSTLLLSYLSSGVLKSQAKTTHSGRSKGFSTSKTIATTASLDLALLAYACQFFSEHIYRSTSEDDNLAEDLCELLGDQNILYWVEYNAQKKDLGNITRTAMNLRGYLERRTKYVSQTDPQVHMIDSWVVDLIRVAAKFRRQLLVCPSSVHCLIPPLCPTESIISKTFGTEQKLSPLLVKGIPVGGWDDCLTRIDFDKGESVALAHGVRLFAVGLSSGAVKIYDTLSVQCIRELSHPERIRLLSFSAGDELLVSSGTKLVTVWDLRSGAAILACECESLPLALTFLGVEELLIASQTSQLIKWNLETEEEETISWLADDEDTYEGFLTTSQPPSRVTFSSFSTDESVLMGVGYRSYPVTVWSPLNLQHLGNCGIGNNNGVLDVTFNPNPEITALVLSYAQGDLCVYNYLTMRLDLKRPMVHATSLACSQDGRTLITGSSQGIIQVFEFDLGRNENMILTPIYRVKASNSGIRGVSFSADGLRFVAIGRRQCQVWGPAALVRKDSELESVSEAIPQVQGAAHSPATQKNVQIMTPLVAFDGEDLVLAGKSDGSVSSFSARDGVELGAIYSHNRGVSVVRLLAAPAKRLIVSADNSGRVLVTRLLSHQVTGQTHVGKVLLSVEKVFDRLFGAAVAHIMVDSQAERLLISGHDIIELWDLSSGQVLHTRSSQQPTTETADSSTTVLNTGSVHRTAIQHPTRSTNFVILEKDSARIFKWSDFTEETLEEGITLKRPRHINKEPSTRAVSYHVGSEMVLEHYAPSLQSPGRIVVWPSTAFDPNSELAGLPNENIEVEAFEAAIQSVIGVFDDSKLLFVDRDQWICSCELRWSVPILSTNPGNKVFRPSRSPSPSGRVGFGRLGSGSMRAIGSMAESTKSGHTRRHFFALSEWRDGTNKFNCTAMPVYHATASLRRRSLDFAFAFGHRIIIIANGTDFSETITINTNTARPGLGLEKITSQDFDGLQRPHDAQWTVVSGSMHRRAFAW